MDMKRVRKTISALLMLTIVFSLVATSAHAFFGSKDDALRNAATEGNLKKVQRLIEEGTDINAKNKTDNTALSLAAWAGHTDIAKLLIEKEADINVMNTYGQTVLMLAASGGHTDIVKLLIEKEADINAVDTHSQTALMMAAGNGRKGTVKFLIENGANINKPTLDGRTALKSAVYGGHTDIVKLLIEKSNNFTRGGALLFAAENDKTEMVKLLIGNSVGDIKAALKTASRYKSGATIAMLEEELQKRRHVREQREKAAKEEAERVKLDAKFERDKKLPLQVRKDKYMVALKSRLKNENYEEALIYFNFLEKLKVELPPSFTFFYGEALLKTGQSVAAMDKLYKYINIAGSKGKYYTRALALTDEGGGRDDKLPLSVRKDKYMVALKKNIDKENYSDALTYFKKLEELNIDMPPSFTFFYGKTLLKAGQPDAATKKLYKYIEIAGSGGKYYEKALELSDEAEAML